MPRSLIRYLLGAGFSSSAPGSASLSDQLIITNDNRAPAGIIRGDTLVLDLEVRMASGAPRETAGRRSRLPPFPSWGRAASIRAAHPGLPPDDLVASVKKLADDSTITVARLVTHPALRSTAGARSGPIEEVRFAAERRGPISTAPCWAGTFSTANSATSGTGGRRFRSGSPGGSPATDPDDQNLGSGRFGRLEQHRYRTPWHKWTIRPIPSGWSGDGDTVRIRVINSSGEPIHAPARLLYYRTRQGRRHDDCNTLPAISEEVVTESSAAFDYRDDFVPDRPGKLALPLPRRVSRGARVPAEQTRGGKPRCDDP